LGQDLRPIAEKIVAALDDVTAPHPSDGVR